MCLFLELARIDRESFNPYKKQNNFKMINSVSFSALNYQKMSPTCVVLLLFFVHDRFESFWLYIQTKRLYFFNFVFLSISQCMTFANDVNNQHVKAFKQTIE